MLKRITETENTANALPIRNANPAAMNLMNIAAEFTSNTADNTINEIITVSKGSIISCKILFFSSSVSISAPL